MFRLAKEAIRVDKRTYKNFGHKREPESLFTFLWHGFLTFTFIGIGIEWKKLFGFMFKEKSDSNDTLSIESSK